MGYDILVECAGPKAFKNVDPFLELIVEEFEELWKGVPCIDVSVPEGEVGRVFNLKAMPISIIADLLGQGTASHYKVSGYGACFNYCGPDMQGKHSKFMKKIRYLEHRRVLDIVDPRRTDTKHWGFREKRGPPKPLIQTEWKIRAKKVEEGKMSGADAGIHGWSIMNRLPYWEV